MTPVVPVFVSADDVEFLRPAPTLEERLLDMGFLPEQIEACLGEPTEYARNTKARN